MLTTLLLIASLSWGGNKYTTADSCYYPQYIKIGLANNDTVSLDTNTAQGMTFYYILKQLDSLKKEIAKRPWIPTIIESGDTIRLDYTPEDTLMGEIENLNGGEKK